MGTDKDTVQISATNDGLIPNPEFYNADKCKRNNDGSCQAFEKHCYRIAYRSGCTIIRVLRVRHASIEPKNIDFFPPYNITQAFATE